MKIVCAEGCQYKPVCYFNTHESIKIGPDPTPLYNIFPVCTCKDCERVDCKYRGHPDSVKGDCKLETVFSNIKGDLGECKACGLSVKMSEHECLIGNL